MTRDAVDALARFAIGWSDEERGVARMDSAIGVFVTALNLFRNPDHGIAFQSDGI